MAEPGERALEIRELDRNPYHASAALSHRNRQIEQLAADGFAAARVLADFPGERRANFGSIGVILQHRQSFEGNFGIADHHPRSVDERDSRSRRFSGAICDGIEARAIAGPKLAAVNQLANQAGFCLEGARGSLEFSSLQFALRDETRDSDDQNHEAREGRHEF